MHHLQDLGLWPVDIQRKKALKLWSTPHSSDVEDLDSGESNSDESRVSCGHCQHRKIKSGIHERPSQCVKEHLTWPQKHLKYSFIDDALSFKQLMFEHLIVGELDTIQITRNSKEVAGRLCLLERVSYWKLRGA